MSISLLQQWRAALSVALLLFGLHLITIAAHHLYGAPPGSRQTGSDGEEDSDAADSRPSNLPASKAELVAVAYANMLQAIERASRPETALDLIETGLSVRGLTVSQESQLLEQKRIWSDRQAKDLHRLGTKWTTQKEVQAAVAKARDLLAQADVRADKNDFDGCLDLLKSASKANENGIRADYTMGLIRTFPHPKFYDVEQAEAHFRTVLNRYYDHPAALNSLAITLIKQGKPAPALNFFERAANAAGHCPEVVHNLNRALYLSEDGRLKLDKNVKKKFQTLLVSLEARDASADFNRGIGWMHMLPVFGPDERTRGQDIDTPAAQPRGSTLVRYSSGTSFVVADGYLVTNRHVIEDDVLGIGDKVTIVAPADPQQTRELDAEIAAISDKCDLAILKSVGLKAKPLPLREALFNLGSDVMILGFPESSQIGKGLKVTRGIVSGLPNEQIGKRILFDATAGPGNSGGPVCDKKGQVGAVLTWKFLTQIAVTGGVPAEEIRTLFKEKLQQELPPPATALNDAETEAVVASHQNSVCQVVVYYHSDVRGTQTAASSRGENPYFEDKVCSVCSGRAWIGCRNRGCVKGGLTEKEIVRGYAGGGGLAIPAQRQVTRRVDCPDCEGGRIDCPGCHEGIDRFLR